MKENDNNKSVIEVCKSIYYLIYLPVVLCVVFLTSANLWEARKGNLSQIALLLPIACMLGLSLLLFWFDCHKKDVKYIGAGLLIGAVIGILAFVNPSFLQDLAAKGNKLLTITETYQYIVWGETNLLILFMIANKKAI